MKAKVGLSTSPAPKTQFEPRPSNEPYYKIDTLLTQLIRLPKLKLFKTLEVVVLKDGEKGSCTKLRAFA